MSQKSRILGLMAKREAAQMAGARRALAGLSKERQAAEAMESKISALLDARKSAQSGPMSASELRGARHMADQLAAEAHRLQKKVADLSAQEADATKDLGQRDHKLRSLNENAVNARIAEQAEREARAEAARTNFNRPGGLR